MTTPAAAAAVGATGVTHAPGCYYVNIVDGAIQRQCNPILAQGLALLGYLGCDGLPADAVNACPTFAAAQAFANAHSVTSAVSGFFGPILMPFNAIGNFFGMLTSRQTLIRVAEGLLGVGLIVVGVMYVLEHSEVVKTTIETGKTAGKAAARVGK